MNLIHTWYVDHRTGRQLMLEKEDDGLVPPPFIQLHEPLVGEVTYSYQSTSYVKAEEVE